jgi:hypothetical protein
MKNYKITVNSAKELYNLEIESFFDDPFMEACTRVVELKKQSGENLMLPPFMIARHDRKNAKEHVYNTYIVLINTGLHKQAENLRMKFRDDSGIDLKEEPICSK